MANPNIRIKRSSVPGKKPTVEQLSSGEIALNTHDGQLFLRRDRTGIGTDIVTISQGGVQVTNVLYVNKDGNDGNSGGTRGDAKASIKSAVAEATTGTVIRDITVEVTMTLATLSTTFFSEYIEPTK